MGRTAPKKKSAQKNTSTKKGKKRQLANSKNSGSSKAQKKGAKQSASKEAIHRIDGKVVDSDEDVEPEDNIDINEEEDNDIDDQQQQDNDVDEQQQQDNDVDEQQQQDNDVDDQQQQENDVDDQQQQDNDEISSDEEIYDMSDVNIIENKIDVYETGILRDLEQIADKFITLKNLDLVTIYTVWIQVHLHLLQVMFEWSQVDNLVMCGYTAAIILSYEMDVVKFSNIFLYLLIWICKLFNVQKM